MTSEIPSQKKENSVWHLLHQLSQKMGVSEIAINNCKSVFVEKDGKFYPLDINLPLDHIHSFIRDVAEYNKKECDKNHPILDGVLPDGSRINIIMEPFVKNGPAITIRKYLHKLKTIDSCAGLFGLEHAWAFFLKVLVKARSNIVVAGGTGVGKTTFLNLLLQEILPEERIIIIEDTRELHPQLPNIVHMEAGGGNLASKATLTHRDLVKNALRMRPDRIIIGESRGEEIIDLLTAMNTGHDGCMTSLHANSPQETLSRMVTLYLMGGRDLPLKAIYGQIHSGVDFIIQLTRSRSNQRIISHITEVTGMEGDTILTQNIALFQNGRLLPTKTIPSNMKLLNQHGLDLDYFSTAF